MFENLQISDLYLLKILVFSLNAGFQEMLSLLKFPKMPEPFGSLHNALKLFVYKPTNNK